MAFQTAGRPPPSAPHKASQRQEPSRNRSFQEQELPDRTRRPSLSQPEDAQALPQVPSSLLYTTDARCKAICFESETQWTVPGSAHRLDVSLLLALDGPNTDVEPKALGESHAHINPPHPAPGGG